ncbi:C2H2 finger domain protein [Diaporthe sp. PMI_573]|nr:C2H2 finger domain protein [Diaporthaceae sp. PMI_573]
MTRRRVRQDDLYEYSDGSNWSDGESSSNEDDDEVFDVEADNNEYEADLSDIDDFDPNDIDVEDAAKLFEGNLYPPEYYVRGIHEFKESAFDGQDYSAGSTVLLDGIEDLWNQYCAFIKYDPQRAFESITLAFLNSFFDWLLSQRTGKDGRKKRGTTKSSSLGTYWKVYRLVYERATGEKLDAKLNRKMHRVLKLLAKKHRLSDQKRENRCMTIDNLKEQVDTTLRTTKKSFGLGELRILCILFLLLLAPTGARPTSVLLRFGDIRVVLARDPNGGPHKILIKFTLEFTKTYLGSKDAKTVTIPEVLFDPSLTLSVQTFLLGMLFRHRAFEAPSLTCPERLTQLDIHPGEQELPIPLKASMKDVYIFRRAIKTLVGYEISSNELISYGMMAGWIKRCGEIAGMEVPTIPYNLRYNAGNVFDRSNEVSDATRNLMLDHANSTPFQRHYLGRQIVGDPYAIIRGLKPQDALVQASCSIGHYISKRRPVDLTADQAASINLHPTIKQLARHIEELRQRRKRSRGAMDEYKDAVRKLRSEKQRLKRALKQQIRDEWTDKQAVVDIEAQLNGLGLVEDSTVEASNCPMRPAQKRLVDALTAPVEASIEGQYQRRDAAINAIVAYCAVVEGPATCRTNSSTANSAQQSVKGDPPISSHLHVAAMSVFITKDEDRPRRCFLCVGEALCLEPDDPRIDKLVHLFYTSGDLTKHFRRRHLANLREDDMLQCRVCVMPLDHKMHLQNHARRIHGTVS